MFCTIAAPRGQGAAEPALGKAPCLGELLVLAGAHVFVCWDTVRPLSVTMDSHMPQGSLP